VLYPHCGSSLGRLNRTNQPVGSGVSVVFKKIELVGVSNEGFFQAVDDAVAEAAKTLKGIKWVEVKNLRAHVDGGEIGEYEATVIVAFEVQSDR